MNYEEKLREIINSNSEYYPSEDKTVLAKYFPELKEPEDEQMWIEIRNFIWGYPDKLPERDKWLAWLEKQREQVKFESNLAWSEEDEEMLKWLCRIIHTQRLDRAITLKEESELGKWIDKWLNHNLQTKQSEQSTDKFKSKFKIGNWFVNNKRKDVFLIKSITNGYCTLEDIKGNIISPCLPPCESDSHIWTIEDAKDGDVLVDEDNNIGIYVGKNDDFWHSCIYLGCDGCLHGINVGAYHKHKNTKPATKEQRDLLFQKMKEEGYEWDAQKKEVKKHIDEVEPRFKEGDWIIFNGLILHIDEIVNGYYRTTSIGDGIHNSYDWNIDNAASIWTIQDAKDGDVLVCEDENFTFPFIAIYKCLGDIVYNNKGLKDLTFYSHCLFYSHCFMGFNGNFYEGEGGHVIEDIHPATKEQRDMLFRKMKEEGYEWDAQKKEVKKPIDEVEPRFKEGDFIMNNDITEDGKPEIFKIIKVCSSWYDVENVYDGRQTMITFSQDYTCHLWTIDDAKQGDILMVDDEFIVVLYRKITDGTECKDTSILTEYEYDINDNTFTKGSHLFYCDICPATYTQREVLTNYIQQVLNWEK